MVSSDDYECQFEYMTDKDGKVTDSRVRRRQLLSLPPRIRTVQKAKNAGSFMHLMRLRSISYHGLPVRERTCAGVTPLRQIDTKVCCGHLSQRKRSADSFLTMIGACNAQEGGARAQKAPAREVSSHCDAQGRRFVLRPSIAPLVIGAGVCGPRTRELWQDVYSLIEQSLCISRDEQLVRR